MTTQITARNQSQSLGIQTVLYNAAVQPTTHYTVPAGKRARVKGWCFCENTGAAATADLNVGGFSIAEWQATGGRTDQNEPQNLQEGIRFDFDVVLEAGDTVQTTQNTGTNAEFHLFMEIEERPQ